MTIDTFATLQTAIQNWLGDSALSTDRADEFIALVEGAINDEIMVHEMETRATLSVSSEYTALPDNFNGLRSRPKITSTDPVYFLRFVTPSQMDTLQAASMTARPTMYTIMDESLRIRPAPDAAYTIEIVYMLKVPALSSSNTTNWLLTTRPHIYIQGCQREAEDYLGNTQLAMKWDARFRRSLETLTQSDKKRRFGGAPLQMSSDVRI